MVLTVNSTLATLGQAFLAVSVILLVYCVWAFQYWRSRNVPYVLPSLYAFVPYYTHLGEYVKYCYNELKRKGATTGGGIYGLTSPKYLAIDLDIIKCIMQKDFSSFTDKGVYHNAKVDPLSENLALLGGKRWHDARMKLNQAFTPVRIKGMIDTFVHSAQQMIEAVDTLRERNEPINLKEIADSYEIDLVGSAMFGLECNSFKDPNAEIRKQAKIVFQRMSFPRYMKNLFTVMYRNFGETFRVKMFTDETARFFYSVVNDAVTYRSKNKELRKDLLQLMIELASKSTDNKEKEIDIQEVTAHTFALFVGGFETSSSTVAFCLYELALHPHIQQQVRDEIEEVLEKHNGKITYDSVQEMKYFAKVYDETLRKYPAVSFITRECTKDYQVPGTDLIINKGILAIVPVMGLHHDPMYFPEPEKFDPERFSEENKEKRPPFCYLPFGEGPRHCIGYRFGLFSTKIAIILFVKNFELSLNRKTKTPVGFCPRTLQLIPKEEVLVDVKRIAKSV